MKVDILYLAKGRDEFTRASFEALVLNTNWSLVDRLVCYTDGALLPAGMHIEPINQCVYHGPVAIMLDWLKQPGQPIWAKIDNDTIVPPGWLDAAVTVMEQNGDLDLLGIEPPASRTPAPWGGRCDHPELRYMENGLGYAPCDSIGGVGLMRRRAFENRALPVPCAENGVGGFTAWQQDNADVYKGWIVPPLKLFLLDRLPMEPWASLSRKYIQCGLQRKWTDYPLSAREDLWGWWDQAATASASHSSGTGSSG